MRYTLKIGLLGMLLLSISSIAMAIKIEGTVVATAGLNVTVKVSGKNLPRQGDSMQISFMIPDGMALSVGTWKVTKIDGRMVSATVVNHTGSPAKGHQVVITSSNPTKLSTASKKNPPKTHKKPKQKSFANVSAPAREVISLLQSTAATDKRNGAKRALKRFIDNPAVMAVVVEELNKGYAIKSKDRYHDDAMAWLCNVIGATKDSQYYDLLKTVYKKSRSKKIKKYAKKNLRKLR